MKISKRVEQIQGDKRQSLCISNEEQSLIFRTYGVEGEYLEMIRVLGVKEISQSTPASVDEALEVLSRVHLLTGEYIHQLISPTQQESNVKEEAEKYLLMSLECVEGF